MLSLLHWHDVCAVCCRFFVSLLLALVSRLCCCICCTCLTWRWVLLTCVSYFVFFIFGVNGDFLEHLTSTAHIQFRLSQLTTSAPESSRPPDAPYTVPYAVRRAVPCASVVNAVSIREIHLHFGLWYFIITQFVYCCQSVIYYLIGI